MKFLDRARGKILCLLGKHDREYWTPEQCREAHLCSGIFAPYKCRRCGFESQRFHLPLPAIASDDSFIVVQRERRRMRLALLELRHAAERWNKSMEQSVTFKYGVNQKVRTNLDDDGIVTSLMHEKGVNKYFVRTKYMESWFEERELYPMLGETHGAITIENVVSENVSLHHMIGKMLKASGGEIAYEVFDGQNFSKDDYGVYNYAKDGKIFCVASLKKVKRIGKEIDRSTPKSTHLLLPTVISGFPGVGKTHYAESHPNVSDSDSSKFSWLDTGERNPEFPDNYIEHIKAMMQGDSSGTILVSSHDVVREAMRKAGITYILAYPSKDSKDEYLKRYADRGSDDKFVKLLDEHWDEWIDSMSAETGVMHWVLLGSSFLGDVIGESVTMEGRNVL